MNLTDFDFSNIEIVKIMQLSLTCELTTRNDNNESSLKFAINDT